MKKTIFPILALMLLIACNNSNTEHTETEKEEIENTGAEQADSVTNFLNTPEQINLKGTDFKLSWSSHPADNYYKQEYIPKDNNIENYKQMIGVELVTGNLTARDAVNVKIQEIEARKATDRVANYAFKEDKETNELVLDFMMSEGTGEATILEWNVYRYANYEDPSGQKGISLFSLSKRGYGIEVAEFGPDIRDNRKKYLTDFISLQRPLITLK